MDEITTQLHERLKAMDMAEFKVRGTRVLEADYTALNGLLNELKMKFVRGGIGYSNLSLRDAELKLRHLHKGVKEANDGYMPHGAFELPDLIFDELLSSEIYLGLVSSRKRD
jgi:hypothetical protein